MTLVVHHMALHLVLLPYVNRVCAQAMDAWNHHRVSTADMRCTPLEKCAFVVLRSLCSRALSWRQQRMREETSLSLTTPPALSFASSSHHSRGR